MAAHARTSAAPAASIVIAVSFPLTERSSSGVTSAFPSRADDPRELQELRADPEPRALRRRDVDVEPDPAPLAAEGDHSPALRELRGLPDGQDGGGLQPLEDAREVVGLRPRDEEDLAIPDVLDPRH